MNITRDILRINGFEVFPDNNEFLYKETKEYKMFILPINIPNTNTCICNIELEYFSKTQKMMIENVKTTEDLERIFDFFDIDEHIVI